MAKPDSPRDGLSKVAQLATQSAPVDMTRLALLGTFGTKSRPGALLRLPSGTVQRVTPGDAVGRATVQAIGDGAVILDDGGRSQTLVLPGERPQGASGGAHAR